jgi:hypothetical protein
MAIESKDTKPQHHFCSWDYLTSGEFLYLLLLNEATNLEKCIKTKFNY